MNLRSRYLLLPLALTMGVLALVTCTPESPPPQATTLYHFGTVIEIKLADASEARAQELFRRADAQLGQWHRRWHFWEPSELTALNAALATGEPVPVAVDLAGLIQRSSELANDSEHLFNPALGKRIAAWGFARHDPNAPAPAPAAVDPGRLPKMADLSWDEQGRLISAHPDLQLDLGGIAKGYALNALLTDLRSQGIQRAMVNIGGDIGVLGALPDRHWRIAVLGGDGKQAVAALDLYDGEQVFSSGTYARRHQTDNGQSAHHIIDPRTGNPAEGNLATTVLGTDGERLQAASKALLIAGSDWRSVARRMQIDLALVIRGDGVIEVTSALAARLEPMEPDGDNWQIIP